MPITAPSTGTQAATVGTEHTLFDSSASGSYQLQLDASVLAAGDAVEIRVYIAVLTGGTRRVVYFSRFVGAQPIDDAGKVTIPISTELADSGAVRFTLKQTKGTGKSFPWKVLLLA